MLCNILRIGAACGVEASIISYAANIKYEALLANVFELFRLIGLFKGAQDVFNFWDVYIEWDIL